MKRLVFFLIAMSNVCIGQVGIGTTSPDASSMLDISSTEAGVLIPRMTEAQRIAISAPATGLLIYQTNNTIGFWFYNGSSWESLSGGGGSGEFQSIGGIVQNTTNVGSDDFVFGSTTLSGSGTRFFFDKSKGAFRAGEAISNEWDDVNVGNNSVAIGSQVTASGSNAVAIGLDSEATNSFATAIGNSNLASGIGSFAAGSTATASGSGGVAFSLSSATGENSFAAVGGIANGPSSIAIQGLTPATANNAIAIGQNASAFGSHSIAIGQDSSADESDAVAIGLNSEATNSFATAIGNSNLASGIGSFAAGSTATASGSGSVAFSLSNAGGENSFAAVGGFAGGPSSISLQGTTTSTANNALAIGQSASASGSHSIAIGQNSSADGSDAVAIGPDSEAINSFATAIGNLNIASGEGSFAAGTFATASGSRAVAFSGSFASGFDSFAATTGNAQGDFSVALIGGTTTSTANDALAIGRFASASGINSIAIGQNATASGEDAVAFSLSNGAGGNSFAAVGGTAHGFSSLALGNVTSHSYAETVIGYNSAAYFPSSTTTAVGTDRLFVVANNTTNNALNILKNGRVGISRIPETNMLEVEGEASKTSAGDWAVNSDRRLKKNIETFSEEKALANLLKLRGVTYEWNDEQTGSKRPEGIQYGFIAQEIEKVFPENVSIDNLGYYQTSYGTYDAMYVQAIKALNNKLESLEAENEALKKEIQKIYSLLSQGSSNEKELVIRD